MDVTPTILGYLGLEDPHARVGVDLTPVLESRQAVLEPPQVPPPHRADVRVDDRRAEAVELLDLRQDFVGEGGVGVGKSRADYLAGAPFVLRVGIREEKAHCQGLDALLLELVQGAGQRLLVEGHVHRAIGADPLRHGHAQVTWH